MTNSHSKHASTSSPIGNRLVFLTTALYHVISDRDVVHKVIHDLQEIETGEEKHYFNTIHSLRDSENNPYNSSYLPYHIQASIHLFREDYMETLSSKSLALSEKKQIVKLVCDQRNLNSRCLKNGTSFTNHFKELTSMKRSIKWLESYKETHIDYTCGGLIIAVQEKGQHWVGGPKGRFSIRYANKDRQAEILHAVSNRNYRVERDKSTFHAFKSTRFEEFIIEGGHKLWWRRKSPVFYRRNDIYLIETGAIGGEKAEGTKFIWG